MEINRIRSLAAGLLIVCLSVTSAYADDDDKMYSVTITNITSGVSFTPLLAITHKAGHPLFKMGEAASSEPVRIAEARLFRMKMAKVIYIFIRESLVSAIYKDTCLTGTTRLPGLL